MQRGRNVWQRRGEGVKERAPYMVIDDHIQTQIQLQIYLEHVKHKYICRIDKVRAENRVKFALIGLKGHLPTLWLNSCPLTSATESYY